jgi:hypothetical protein
MCPRKTFVIDVIIQEELMRSYWVPMILNAVGLIAHVENLKNPDTKSSDLNESKMNEIIVSVNRTYSIIEVDKLHCELRIMDRIYQVCINEIKSLKGYNITPS